MYENRKSFDAAKRLRETFVDRPMTKVDALEWEWPKRLEEVGTCEAVMYTSDKWKPIGEFEDYKHVAEGSQRLFVKPGFIVDHKSGKPLELYSEVVPVEGPLPDAIAVLAPILGIQARFYDDEGEPGDYFQINVARAKLGAAKHPKSGETFLVVFTPKELVAIITGTELDVEKDGIVG